MPVLIFIAVVVLVTMATSSGRQSWRAGRPWRRNSEPHNPKWDTDADDPGKPDQ